MNPQLPENSQPTAEAQIGHSGNLPNVMREHPVRSFDKTLEQAKREGLLVTPQTPGHLSEDNFTDQELEQQAYQDILAEEDRIALLRKSEKADKATKPESHERSNTFVRFIKSRAGKATMSILLTSGLAAGTVAVVSSNNDSAPTEKLPSHSAETATKTQTEILQNKIDARPKQGTAEYEQLFKKLEIPYVAGQSHEDVVAKYVDTVNQYNTLGFSEAPHTSDDQTKWALEHNSVSRQDTLDSIVAGLNLDYYDSGAMLAIFGADGQNTQYAHEVIKNLRTQKDESLAYALSGQVKPDAAVTKISENIIKEDANNIAATFTGYSYPGTAEKPNIQASCHLRIFTDSHGKATWVLVGQATSDY